MKLEVTVICLVLAMASGALAHVGVKNAAVMARMDAMKTIGAGMKTIGQMAKGETRFNATEARAAAADIARHAAQTHRLFEAREDDPKSEAKAEIWENFAAFVAISDDLASIASNLSRTIETKADLPAAMAAMGRTCRDCHNLYRE
ncbi:MAG: cytochrome c [Roseobacter sp.]|jgi:cytochrome c556|nr:cytochrome c [Roseobacter sp.]